MKVVILTVKKATQAKLLLRPQLAVMKIPGNLPESQQIEIRNKLMRVVDLNPDVQENMKCYYKVGTPYLFLNKKLSSQKRETAEVYKFAEL